MKHTPYTARFRYLLYHLWLVPLAMPGGGCISAQQMRPVAEAGIEASLLAKQATANVRANISSFREAEFIAASLGTGFDASRIEQSANKMDEICTQLLARQVMFGELEQMYVALKAIAEYDAPEAIDGVVNGAASAALAYANELRPANVPATESVSSSIHKAAASIISGIQKRQLAIANRGLADLNEAIVSQLQREKASRIAIGELLSVPMHNILIGLLQ